MPNPENIKPYEWKPGQSGNPKGTKPKIMTNVLKELRAAGFEPVSKDQINDAFAIVMAMSEDEVKSMIQDKAQPMLMRIVGKRFLSNDGHEMLEKMLDRAHGKAKQQVDHLSGGEKISPTINLTHIGLDDLRRLAEDTGDQSTDQTGSKS